MKNMKFSIIIPVYNAEKYINETIKSIMAQQYTNYEVILIDDGSTDASGSKCDYYAHRYDGQFFCYHTVNQGPYLARKYGVEKATGDILIFMDSDDCIRKDMLTTLKNTFEKEDCDLIMYNASTDYDYSRPFRDFGFKNMEIFEHSGKADLYEKMLLTSELNNICLKACKNSIFENLISETQDQFKNVRHGEDLLMSAYAITMANRVLFLEQNLYYYRQRTDSIVHTFDAKRIESLKTVHSEIEKYIEIWGIEKKLQKYYSRRVKGWVESVLILIMNKHRMDKSAYRDELNRLCDEDYFRHSFEGMDKNYIPFLYYIVSKWLYEKKYTLVEFIVFIKKTKQKICSIIVK